MDAPLIILDDAANTTDVYAFVSEENGRKSLVTALGVYPFEEPGIGPNKYNFDDNVLYEIHVALGKDVAAGRPTHLVPVPLHDAVQEQAHDPAVLSRRGQRRERRGPEPDAVLHGDQGRSPQRPADRARQRHRAAEQPGHRHAVLQPGRQRRATRPRKASPPPTSSIATRSSRSPRSTTATSRSPGSATTASTPTSRRSSICCSCAIPARTRRVDSTCT